MRNSTKEKKVMKQSLIIMSSHCTSNTFIKLALINVTNWCWNHVNFGQNNDDECGCKVLTSINVIFLLLVRHFLLVCSFLSLHQWINCSQMWRSSWLCIFELWAFLMCWNIDKLIYFSWNYWITWLGADYEHPGASFSSISLFYSTPKIELSWIPRIQLQKGQ
jgi:hypothetical protein